MKRRLKKIVLKTHERDSLQIFIEKQNDAYISFQLASRFAKDAGNALHQRLEEMFSIMKDKEAMGILKHPRKGAWTIEYYEHEKE